MKKLFYILLSFFSLSVSCNPTDIIETVSSTISSFLESKEEDPDGNDVIIFDGEKMFSCSKKELENLIIEVPFVFWIKPNICSEDFKKSLALAQSNSTENKKRSGHTNVAIEKGHFCKFCEKAPKEEISKGEPVNHPIQIVASEPIINGSLIETLLFESLDEFIKFLDTKCITQETVAFLQSKTISIEKVDLDGNKENIYTKE